MDLLRFARTAPDQQRTIAARLATGQAKTFRTARLLDIADVIQRRPKLPAGPFDVIVCDPPWSYGRNQRTEYPAMPVEEISAMPIAQLAAADCVLWLWTTNAHFRDAFRCLDAWGFRERTILTWIKTTAGAGTWLRGQSEHCILAVRGTPVVTLTKETTVLCAPTRQHSRKPLEFFRLADRLCPGSKIELFARETRPGWSSWGSERTIFDLTAHRCAVGSGVRARAIQVSDGP